MPPGRAATLRCMPLTRYECFGRPHNPVHYFSSELRFSWHGNSPHSLPVAFMQQACIRTQLHLANRSKRCTPALKGFVCAALLRCSWHGNSLHSQSAAPAQHDSAALRLEGLRLRNHAFAVTATARIRSRLHLVQQACIRTQLHLALAAVRCPQVVQPPSATCR